ncbi:hypothetical protein SpCBS45565_g02812 [Spizellomyces sp. 'palustris']|nr:hypothetical protein SpCBS45565_g02812 [Spizellomyces sp. 'palustris']
MARRTLVSLCAGIAALAALASASDSSAPYASLHLYPRLKDGAPRDISWTQATSLVSHVVAVSAGAGDILQPVNILEVQDNDILDDAVKDIKFDILGAPKANLWVVIDDYHAESGLLDSVPAYQIYTEDDTVDSQLVEFGERAARAIVKNVPGSWPLIISSNGQAAVMGQVSAVHVGEKRVDVSAQVKLPSSIRKTLTAISETLYEDMRSHAIEKFGESAQSLNSNNPEDMHLMAEVEFATSLIEAFKVQRVASAGKPIDVPSFIAVTFSGLSRLRDRYGERSAQYENGATMVKKAISEGCVILYITPLTADLTQIRLNCRQSKILKVLVNEVETKYVYDDPLTPVVPPSSRKTAYHHPEYRQHYTYALQESDEGELVIDIPEQVPVPIIQTTQTNGTSELSTQPSDIEQSAGPRPPAPTFATIQVQVTFTLTEPRSGLHFFLPDALVAPDKYPQLYSNNQTSSARLWIPCIDRYQERCTWDIQCVTPRTLRDALPETFGPGGVGDEIDEETGQRLGDREMLVLCSGELDEQVLHPVDTTKKISSYVLSNPVCPASIMLAIGPFDGIPISEWMSATVPKDMNADEQEEVDTAGADAFIRDRNICDGGYAFCLPGRREQLEYTTSFVAQALAFFEQYLGVPFPFGSYKQVFLEDTYNPAAVGATLAVFSSHLLLEDNIIDQTYETMRLLCRALVTQWFGHYIVPKTWADTWLTVGLTNYIVGLFLERFLGKNEYKFRLKKDMQRVCELDVNQPPVYPTTVAPDDPSSDEQPTMIDPLVLQHFHPDDDWASVRSEFLSLKSPIILYMLERRMGKGMLQKMVNKILLSAAAGELPNGLSTHHFLRVARKLTGKLELKTFADQWIYGSGCPRFSFKYNFNRKKMMVEFKFRQENTNGGIVGSTPKFTGPFTIRIHEPGGTYDTEVHIEDLEKQYDIQYHTKYKRIRRKPITAKSKKGTEAGGPEEGTQDVTRAEEGRIEWIDEEPERLTFEWIRLDPDNQWLCIKIFEQSDYMWAAQLQKDRDVNAQYEMIYLSKAIEALDHLPSQGTCSVLSDFVGDITAYYGLRMEAAYALARCTSEHRGALGVRSLLDTFREKFCFGDANDPEAVVPKSNDFTEMQEYYVKKALISAIATVRELDDIAPIQCRRFLLALLKFNDNTGNSFSDNYFVANLIVAVGNSFLPTARQVRKRPVVAIPPGDGTVEEFSFGGDSDDEDPSSAMGSTNATAANIPLFREALREVHRYRNLDRLMPSYHNAVTAACLETLLKWMLATLIPVDMPLFLQHARYGNFLYVRIIAIDALVVLGGLSIPEIAEWLLRLVADDAAPYIRYHVAKALAEFIGVITGETKGSIVSTPGNNGVLLNSGVLTNGHGNRQNIWDYMRFKLSQRQDIAKTVWHLMNSNEALDHRVRTYLLRFCEYLYDPAPEEPLAASSGPVVPKLRIKMPLKPADDVRLVNLNVAIGVTLMHQLQSASDEEAPPAVKKVTIKNVADSLSKPKSSSKPTPPRVRTEDTKPVFLRPNPLPPEILKEPDPVFKSIGEGMLTRLRNHPSSASFILPVDPANTHYYQVIKKPMDLQTAGRNLQAGVYADDLSRLFMDIRQIFKNCYEYNLEESNVHRQAKKLEGFFEESVVPEALDMQRRATEEDKMQSTTIPSIPSAVTETKASRISRPSSPPAPLPPTPPAPPSRSILPTPAISKPVLSVNDMRRCRKTWRFLYSHELSHWFRAPVDPVALNIPTYYEIIKKPMDLSTIKKKLDQNAYSTPAEFQADVRLMLNNAITFNLPDTQVHKDSQALLGIFEKTWPESSQAPDALRPMAATNDSKLVAAGSKGDLSATDATRCERALVRMESATQSAGPFLQPVSRVLYPDYFEIVKEPMDLLTVRKNLRNKNYKTLQQFENDVRLIFTNCFTFNRPGEPVYIQGKDLEAIFEREWGRSKTGSAGSAPSGVAKGRPQSLQVSANVVEPSPRVTSDSRHQENRGVPLKSTSDGKACARILKKLQRHPNAQAFLQPVDPVALNIPQYFDIIKRPMDLSTVQKKLESGEYKASDEFRDDVNLMLSNCFRFNLPGDWVYEQGKGLEAAFKKDWKSLSLPGGSRESTPLQIKREGQKPPSRSSSPVPQPEPARPGLSSSEEQIIQKMLKLLREHTSAVIFLEPVDANVLPDYYTKIKTPIDLQTMQTKLDQHVYNSTAEFEADVTQLFANCYLYNAKTSYGHNCGVALEKFFKKEWKALVEKQAPAGDTAGDQGSKKRKREKDDAGQVKDKKQKANPALEERSLSESSATPQERAGAPGAVKRKKTANETSERKKTKSQSAAETTPSAESAGAPPKGLKLKLKVKK